MVAQPRRRDPIAKLQSSPLALVLDEVGWGVPAWLFRETARHGRQADGRAELNGGRGVYPPVETKRVCKELKIKGICGVLLNDDENDGRQVY
jgi:hypothetical protein